MKKRTVVSWSIVALSVLIFALIWLQISHVIFSYYAAAEIYERSINEAVNQTTIALQKQEVAIYVYDRYKSQESKSSLLQTTPMMSVESLEALESESISSTKPIKIGDKPTFFIKDDDAENVESYYISQLDEPKSAFNKLAYQLEAEFSQRQIPIEQRFTAETIGKVLRRNLNAFGVDLDFEFAIFDDNTQEIKIATENFDTSRMNKCYKYNIVNGSITDTPNLIIVDFPNKGKAIWKAILSQIILSVLISALFIIAFSIAIGSIVKQKRINTMKNDFVNNMTHEFKTPIATIKLATTAIKSPQILENKENVSKMCDVILQETTRMTQHVEQVLQIASLDRRGLKLNLTTEDPNAFIRDIVSYMELQVSQKGGKILINTCDSDLNIAFDTSLMTNVVMNLLDNAIKYTKEAPIIKVSTYTKDGRFCFSVKDNGIGMSKETQSHVFERFYRAHTGNTHNIKGFGLGLNYTKEIVLAHKGFISVNSTEGKGSTFTVSLPLTLKDINYE